MKILVSCILRYLRILWVVNCYKLKQPELNLKDDVVPIFCKPWVLPFALKDKVSE